MTSLRLKSVLLGLLLGFGAVTAQAAISRIIHDWTVHTPLGDFGWIEIGGDGLPNERHFLLGQFAYFPTRASAPVVATAAAAVVAACGIVGLLLLRRRYAHKVSLNP